MTSGGEQQQQQQQSSQSHIFKGSLVVVVLFLSAFLLLVLGASTPGKHFNLSSTVSAGKDILFRGPLKHLNSTGGLPVGVGAETSSDAANQPKAKGQKKKKVTSLLPKQRKKKGASKKGSRKSKKGANKKNVEHLADYKLTRELVEKYAKDNFITVSFGNLHYMGFIENWVKHLQEMGVDNYVVGAMDDDALRGLIDRDINAFSMSHSFPRSDFGWGTQTFYKMARRKIKLIQEFLNMNFDVMVSDVDTVWLQDPNVFFKKHPKLDIMTSSDALRTTSINGQFLEDADRAREAYNIGILYFRATNATREFLDDWVSMIEKNTNYWDQNAFNDLLRKDFSVKPKGRFFKSYHDRLKVGVLPVSSFCNGHTYFVQSMPETLHVQPYVIHATFQYSGTEGKRHRFRERMLWYDHPEYYAPDNGVLVYDADVPEGMLEKSAFHASGGSTLQLEDTRPHFDLVNHQLKQLRNAIGVAKALNRTLVMPKIFCGLDRWWAPHDGEIPGSKFQRPFVCPLDHVIEVNVLLNGKYIDFREYSFLENPRTPESFKDSQLRVRVCGSGDKCEEEGGKGEIRIPAKLDDTQIQKKLRQYSHYKVLRFTSMLDTFGGFSKPAKTNDFRRIISSIMSIWCCVRAPTGHIWYDMLWDVVPHVDKHNRRWDQAWDMKLGP